MNKIQISMLAFLMCAIFSFMIEQMPLFYLFGGLVLLLFAYVLYDKRQYKIDIETYEMWKVENEEFYEELMRQLELGVDREEFQEWLEKNNVVKHYEYYEYKIGEEDETE